MIVFSLFCILVLTGLLLSVLESVRWIPWESRDKLRRPARLAMAAGLGLGGAGLILLGTSEPMPWKELAAVHGRQAVGGAFLFAAITAPQAVGVVLIAAAVWCYRASRI